MQLVVTLGFPDAMVDCTWQCLEVVVAGWMCTSISPSMVGHAACSGMAAAERCGQ